MIKRTFAALSIAALATTGTAFAQANAAVTLRSGERLNAEVMDLGGVGFTVRVDGQQRQIPANDVAAIDFTGGTPSSSDWDKLNNGGQFVILKSGENIAAQLVDIGGSSPLRMTFRTSSGDRDFTSNDIARVIIARPNNVDAAIGSTGTSTAQGITVSGQQQWTPTGVVVRRGDWVTFNTSGEIRIGGDGNPTATAAGVSNVLAPGAPVAQAAAGALIGRINNGTPFVIGDRARVQMPAAGQLFLGVNDGHLPDNDGSYQVQVAREGGAIRR